MTKSGYPVAIEKLAKAHAIDINSMDSWDRAWVLGARCAYEVAIAAHSEIAARCNDSEPVAPIGDAYIDTLKAAMNSLIFVNANYSSIPGGLSRAQIIRDLRDLLAAMAAQGDK